MTGSQRRCAELMLIRRHSMRPRSSIAERSGEGNVKFMCDRRPVFFPEETSFFAS